MTALDLSPLFTSPPGLERAFEARHEWWLIALSLLTSVLASTSALALAARLQRMGEGAWRLPLVGLIQGTGVWAMHFIGMLSFRLDCGVQYDFGLTALSVLPGVLGSTLAWRLETRAARHGQGSLAAGLALAAGVGAMHYTGMAALQLGGLLRHDPRAVVLSLLACAGLAWAALAGRRRLAQRHGLSPLVATLAGGVLLGLAIAAMHYLSMGGAHFLPLDDQPVVAVDDLGSRTALALAVLVATLVVIAIGAVHVLGQSRLVSMRHRLDLVLSCSSQAFATLDAQGCVDRGNPALSRLIGLPLREIHGRRLDGFFPGQALGTQRGSYRQSAQLQAADGSLVPCLVRGDDAFDHQGRVLYTFAWIEDTREQAAAEAALREARDQAEAAQAQVRTLLDNSGQGFFIVGPDLRVLPGFSRECQAIFGGPIDGRDLPEMLVPEGIFDADEQRDGLRTQLQRTLACEHPVRREAYLELLPAELCLAPNTFRVQYKPLEQGQLMLILTDITSELRLQERVRAEHRRVEYLINAMENRADLLKLLASWKRYLGQQWLQDRTHAATDRDAATALLRQVHTFKGLFAQDFFPSMPQALHDLEAALGALREAHTGLLPAGPTDAAVAAADLDARLRQDLASLSESLGFDCSNAELTQEVPLRVIEHVEQAVEATEGLDSGLRAAVAQLRLQPLSRLLDPHFKSARLLAPQLGKQIHPIQLQGHEVHLDAVRTEAFIDSLVHLFRNCVDHGIEPTGDREDLGKPGAGTIRCHARVEDGLLLLTVSDDGRGIVLDAVREAAVRQGVVDADAAAGMDAASVMDLVFCDRLSTRAAAGLVSGRGVGLAAVRGSLEALGGQVTVHSRAGQGCRFELRLPLIQPEHARDPLGQATPLEALHAA